jgi:hypothetical protein
VPEGRAVPGRRGLGRGAIACYCNQRGARTLKGAPSQGPPTPVSPAASAVPGARRGLFGETVAFVQRCGYCPFTGNFRRHWEKSLPDAGRGFLHSRRPPHRWRKKQAPGTVWCRGRQLRDQQRGHLPSNSFTRSRNSSSRCRPCGSMGPRSGNRGYATARARVSTTSAASMGSRSGNRGYDDGRARVREVRVASMGPRSGNRGYGRATP